MERVSLPSDFEQKMQSLLKDEWDDFARSYENGSCQGLRLNPLKKGLDRPKYGRVLERLGIKNPTPVPWAEDAFYYEETARPGRHPYHEMGLYYIQEPSAMSAAALLKPAPGERVLDLCAAPGGKSTQLATALSGKGLLIANEIHAGRCRILAQNIERMGITNAVVTNEDCEKLALRFPAYFHKILVDAPCSGEGMFRKNPDAMQQWSLEQVKVCADRQRDILHQAAGMLMPGGTLVYSTCTFSPEENEGVISRLISEHEELELVKADAPWFGAGRPAWADGREELNRCFRLFPHHLRGEGHFAAVLHKKGEIPKAAPIKERRSAKALKGVPDQAMMQVFREFCAGTLSEETERFLLSGRLVLFGDQLYRLPDEAPSLDGLRVLRAGLHVGTFQKKRFEPSHALALFLGSGDVKNCVQFSGESGDTAAYFRGETLQAQDGQGFCLVCVDGFSAGWGKLAGGRLKNHYPKGLRKDFGDC